MDAVTAVRKHSGFAKIGQEGLVINVIELLPISHHNFFCNFMYHFNTLDVENSLYVIIFVYNDAIKS